MLGIVRIAGQHDDKLSGQGPGVHTEVFASTRNKPGSSRACGSSSLPTFKMVAAAGEACQAQPGEKGQLSSPRRRAAHREPSGGHDGSGGGGRDEQRSGRPCGGGGSAERRCLPADAKES